MDPNRFYSELKAHLEEFRHSGGLPQVKVPVTITGIPQHGLTMKYQHPSAGSADPAEIASEAAKVIGAAGVGAVGGAAVGAVIGKIVLGGTLARVGVASAGATIGIPLLAPVALAGGAIATVAYAAYKIGSGNRNHERAKDLADSLIAHMQGFSPPDGWPEIEMYVSVPDSGLAALWQPTIEGEE